MDVRIDEIAEQTYRLSVFIPHAADGAGFTFNHFLIVDDEPLLFHCGFRKMFPLVSAAVGKIMPVDRLRWLSFGHFEADECGSMNEWLAAAPGAEVMHGMTGCRVSIADMADRAPRSLANGEVVDIGSKRIWYIDTPHVPHGWDAGVIYEETTSTLFCGDLFARLGNGPPLTGNDVVEPAMIAEDFYGLTSLGPTTAPNIRSLAELKPKTLAIMHGSSFAGDSPITLKRGCVCHLARRSICSEQAPTSAVGTFRTCRDVCLGSGMRTGAEIRLNSSGPGEVRKKTVPAYSSAETQFGSNNFE